MCSSKYIFLTFVFLSVCSLARSEEEENVHKLFRISRSNYRYNHPPAAEIEVTVPVAIVYDKVADRGDRTEKKVNQKEPNNVSKSEKIASVDVADKEILKGNIKNSDHETLVDINTSDRKDESARRQTPARSQRPRQRNSQSRVNETDKKIPVAIVFDKAIDKTGHTENKSQQNANGNLNDNKNISIEHTNDDTSRGIKTPQAKHLELNIPVSVVYDEEPRTKQRQTANKRVRTGARKENQKINTDLKTEQKSNIESVKSETGVVSTDNSTEQVSGVISQSQENKSQMTATILENPEKSKKRTRERDPVVPIIESENKIYSQNGEFSYSYEGGDGTKAYSNGVLKSFDEDKKGEAVVGGFSYKDKDGTDYSLSYTADENGYRPIGAHLPTSPPIPAAIARALKYLATKATPEPVTEALETNPPVKSTEKPSKFLH